LSGVLKNLGAKERAAMSARSGEMAGMATTFMEKVLAGPGKGKAKGDKAKKPDASGLVAPDKDELPRLDDPAEDDALDPRLESIASAVHARKANPKRGRGKAGRERPNGADAAPRGDEAPAAQSPADPASPRDLPLRPSNRARRVGGSAGSGGGRALAIPATIREEGDRPGPAAAPDPPEEARGSPTTLPAAATEPGVGPTKAQLKNRKKRLKLKNKLAQLKRAEG
jgi:hypothetical protein